MRRRLRLIGLALVAIVCVWFGAVRKVGEAKARKAAQRAARAP